MPIDPRVAAMRGQMAGPMGQPPNPYMQGLQQPVQLQPQSGLGMQGQGPSINAGTGTLTPATMNAMAGGMPAQEQFEQGARMGDQADVLRDSSLEDVQGKMVGRVYVPASIFQHGAKVVQAFVARRKEKQQKEERAGARKEQSSMLVDWLRSQDTGAPASATPKGIE